MKKQLFTLIFMLSMAFTASTKDKVIVNPVVNFVNTGINHLTKIELGDKETRLHIHTVFLPNWWVKFPKTTYIEDCATGEKWQATGILNGEFDKEIFMPASGDSTFVLIFPKLDKKIKKINYVDTEASDVSILYGISLDPKAVKKSQEMPSEMLSWLDGEVAKSKRKSLMDFKSGEFFSKDTARLVGYIKGYDSRAGFATGIVYASNEITREDYPIVIQIHEDGRFEGNIPMVFPENLQVNFDRNWINFYIQPGETLAMVLDWNEFLTADRLRDRRYQFSNITYQGVSAQINKELTAFNAQLPELPYRKIYGDNMKKEVAEYKALLDSITADYTNRYKHLLETEKLSEQTRKILQDNYTIEFATFLMDYENDYGYRNRESGTKLPVEFYDFLQDIPMNDKELLSIQNFSTFINRFEYASTFQINHNALQPLPEKTFVEYLFDELKIKKTPEDIRYIEIEDSAHIYQRDMMSEKSQKFFEKKNSVWEAFLNRHGEDKYDAYHKKYMDVLIYPTRGEQSADAWRQKDSIYSEVLKLQPSIIYEIAKVRSLDSDFKYWKKDQKEDAAVFLNKLKAGIADPFLKEEADRLFQKHFPLVKPVAYELPNTAAAKVFKDIIAPYKGKYLLVDFWATWCGPCVGAIKEHKEFREKQNGIQDVDFVFITDESSPLDRYNKFVEEQELTNTVRLNEDDYRYLRQLFKFNGIPHYVIVDREGRILNENASSFTFEQDLKEILETEKNQ